jgi:hypothetical protein
MKTTPISPPSGTATDFFGGLHHKSNRFAVSISKFLAVTSILLILTVGSPVLLASEGREILEVRML